MIGHVERFNRGRSPPSKQAISGETFFRIADHPVGPSRRGCRTSVWSLTCVHDIDLIRCVHGI